MRRAKWHPPPPPTPRILQLPRRGTRRKQPSAAAVKPNPDRPVSTGKLERLFDQERAFSYISPPPPVVLLNSRRREKVVEEEEISDDVEERDNNEERWRFQTEMLRAECNFLRLEREIAVKKLERERGFLKSALHTLLNGKKKISEGKSGNLVMEEEIEELTKKLVELQSCKIRSPELGSCSNNFDKQAFLLQKQIEKLDDEICVKEIHEVSGANHGRIEGFSFNLRHSKFADDDEEKHMKIKDDNGMRWQVERLRRKMEGLSKGKLLKRMEEEYGSMLMLSATPTTNSTSNPNSASTSRRYELADISSSSFQQSPQDTKTGEPRTCSGHCKTIVRRIMEQVRAETQQWSHMQEMLGQVREEMEELQASRYFWEARALESDNKIQALHSEVEEWKQRALSLEVKENQMHKQVREYQEEIEKSRIEESCNPEVKASKDLTPASLGAQLEKEKRVLKCRVKGSNVTSENGEQKVVDYSDRKKSLHKNSSRLVSLARHPFKDIGNVSPLVRHNSRRYVYPLHNPKDS